MPTELIFLLAGVTLALIFTVTVVRAGLRSPLTELGDVLVPIMFVWALGLAVATAPMWWGSLEGTLH